MADKNKLNKKYMETAFTFADMSHAQRKKVGAVIVKDGNILSIGWNGTPRHFSNECEYELDGKMVTRQEVLHAESNALMKLLKSTQTSEDAEIYITLSPCLECAKLIVQSGIKRVFYAEEYRDSKPLDFLLLAGIDVVKLEVENEI